MDWFLTDEQRTIRAGHALLEIEVEIIGASWDRKQTNIHIWRV